jgi:hypothetical protein
MAPDIRPPHEKLLGIKSPSSSSNHVRDMRVTEARMDHLHEHVHQHDTEHENEDEHEHKGDQECD